MIYQQLNMEDTALAILKKFRVKNENVFQVLSQKQTSSPQIQDSSKVLNVLIGNNEIALESAGNLAKVILNKTGCDQFRDFCSVKAHSKKGKNGPRIKFFWSSSLLRVSLPFNPLDWGLTR